MLKKLLVVVFAAVLAIGFIGCKKKEEAKPAPKPEMEATDEKKADDGAATEEKTDDTATDEKAAE